MKYTTETKQQILSELGKNIKFYRDAQGLTLTDLSILTGISESKLSNYENAIAHPEAAKLVVIAIALNVSLAHLFPLPPK